MLVDRVNHTFFHVGNSYDLDGYVELSQTFLRHPIVLQLDTHENKRKSWRNLKEECNLGILDKYFLAAGL